MAESPSAALRTPGARTVALVTLGCARNEVDSEELAGRLTADGWTLVDDPDDAETLLVNTCGFVEQAKKDSVDTLLAGVGEGRHVVAVGCLAERYGKDLAAELPETTVLGFDDYAAIGDRLDDVVAGRTLVPHTPSDRRLLLPISPTERAAAVTAPTADGTLVGLPGHQGGPAVVRRRLGEGPVAPVKLASGCDRRCAFCAIPTFRGAFVSRRPTDVLDDARWLASTGARELVLVSENSTSYGKDLGDIRLLETLLPDLAAVEGVVRVRVAYLQPAELRPTLLSALLGTPGVAHYLDLSFQHASPTVLRRMRRFGGTTEFLGLLHQARAADPDVGARSNVIVGFPGETEDDVAELERFLVEARLDAVGVFGYSDEDGTEAEGLDGHLDDDVVAQRVARISALVEELTAQRAEDRVGDLVDVLVETVEEGPDGLLVEGRAEHQGPEDGSTRLELEPGAPVVVGDLVRAIVVGAEGVDLVAAPVPAGVGPGPHRSAAGVL